MIGSEVVLRVAKTPKGHKVKEMDGRGLADGYHTQPRPRYFYGDTSGEDAHAYAERRAESIREDGDDARVVPLGERVTTAEEG